MKFKYMENYECMKCLVGVVLDMIDRCCSESAKRMELAREALKMLSLESCRETPVEIAGVIHRYIREMTGTLDPYKDVKYRRNIRASEISGAVRKRIDGMHNGTQDRIKACLKASAAGNILDSTAGNDVLLEETLEKVFKLGFAKDCTEEFLKALENSRNIMYITDNAGEIFFDKLLIEELVKLGKDVVVGVRGFPASDDALEEDYRTAGLDLITGLVDTGTPYQGVVMSEVSEEFRDIFNKSDIIIAKGMGNFETMGMLDDRRLFLLLIAKCRPVAEAIGVQTGDFCFIRAGKRK
jgi:damage-control phosphatase, subfamily I